jgi:hypothetical protein
MDEYSGLIDLFEKKGVLAKDGNKLKYMDKTGKEHKYFRSGITDDLLDLIMSEWDESKIVMDSVAESDDTVDNINGDDE